MEPADLDERLEFAIATAREAGALTLRYFRTDDLQVEQKADASPVTIADRQAEQLVRERIASRFPDDAVLGEEFPARPGTSGYRWIVDPIDGTKSFVRGVPLYGTLLGMEFDNRPALGVIYMPALDECAHAARGRGAWHAIGSAAARRARVSTRASLAESLICTSDMPALDPASARGQAVLKLGSASVVARTWGDCYGYLLVATGRAEVMLDPIMNVWDACAIAPIVEEAGGTFTDWKGEPTIHHGEGIATNGHVLAAVLHATRNA